MASENRQQATPPEAGLPGALEKEVGAEVGAEAVRKLLRQVVNPEVGVNIVNLGLIYRIDFAPDRVRVEMTMTSPACPMGEMIMDDACAALAKGLPAACVPEIVLVWSPPWDPSMMSERSRLNLGWQAE